MNDYVLIWIAGGLSFILALFMAWNGNVYYSIEFKWIAILLFFVGALVRRDSGDLSV